MISPFSIARFSELQPSCRPNFSALQRFLLGPPTRQQCTILGLDFLQEPTQSVIAAGSASVDAVHVGITGQFVVVLHAEAVGVDEEFVDVCLQVIVQPILVVEGVKWLVDWRNQILWRGPRAGRDVCGHQF